MLQQVTKTRTEKQGVVALQRSHDESETAVDGMNVETAGPANDAIKKLFAKGDDATTKGAALQPYQDYASALQRELGISTLNTEITEALDDFTKDVIMSAGWYQHRYLQASKEALKFIAINVFLVIGMPIAIIAFGAAAAHFSISATPSQIAAMLTGVFALQKTLSAWYAQRQQYATWYATSCGLKCLYTTFIQKWAGHAEPPSSELLVDMRKTVSTAQNLTNAERMAFYKALTPPSFDVLGMLTTQQSTVTTLVSNLLPAKKPANDDTAAETTTSNDTEDSETGDPSPSLTTDDQTQSEGDNSAQSTGALPDAEIVPIDYKPPSTPSGLTDEAVELCFNSGLLTNAADIDRLFGGNFIDWFNINMKGSAPFLVGGHNQINTSPITRQHFQDFWNRIPRTFGATSIIAPQFIALMCINIQECAGNFWGNTEVVGRTGGLKYCYEAIENKKNSYNINPDNFTAYKLFNDSIYVNAHKGANNGYVQVVTGGIDQTWNTGTWPSQFVDTTPDARTDFIAQCDFYKLRGRGVIQTTARTNYRSLLQCLFSNQIALDSAIMTRVSRLRLAGTINWSPSKLDLDRVLSECTDAELDTLFGDPDVLAAAVYDYAKTNYRDPAFFSLKDSAGVLGATTDIRGSYFHVGRCINGSTYSAAVRSKMIAMTMALARHLNPNVGVPRPAQDIEI